MYYYINGLSFYVDRKIVGDKQKHANATHFYGQADATAQHRQYRPIEGVQGFT
jgi:hypothetical protein